MKIWVNRHNLYYITTHTRKYIPKNGFFLVMDALIYVYEN